MEEKKNVTQVIEDLVSKVCCVCRKVKQKSNLLTTRSTFRALAFHQIPSDEG